MGDKKQAVDVATDQNMAAAGAPCLRIEISPAAPQRSGSRLYGPPSVPLSDKGPMQEGRLDGPGHLLEIITSLMYCMYPRL
jgi:hypothetical protein